MTAWRGALLSGVLFAAGACSDDPGSAAVDDAVAALAASPDAAAAFAAAVEAVSEDGADAASAQALADALPRHLDELTGLDRPAVVRTFEALFRDEEASERTIDALADWVETRVEPLIAGTVTEEEMKDLLRTEVAPVIGAAQDGVERSGTLSYGELRRSITQPVRKSLALQVAERDGLPAPVAGEYAETLSNAWPSGDPIEELDRAAVTEAKSHSDDDDW